MMIENLNTDELLRQRNLLEGVLQFLAVERIEPDLDSLGRLEAMNAELKRHDIDVLQTGDDPFRVRSAMDAIN